MVSSFHLAVSLSASFGTGLRRAIIKNCASFAGSFAKVFPNTISTLTSFINEQQYEVLDLIADKIILVFDDDKAGNYGIQKMKDTYGSKKLESITLGDNDSNDYLRMKSEEEFHKFITAKVPFMLRG